MKKLLPLAALLCALTAPAAPPSHPVLSHPEEQLNLPYLETETLPKLQKEFQQAAAMPMSELLAAAEAEAAKIRFVNQRAGHYEDLANLFAHACSGGEKADYAERSLRLLETVARKTAHLNEMSLDFFNSGRTIPPGVYAYDRLYSSPAWSKLPPDARGVIENWFARVSYILLRRLGDSGEIHNMMPHAIQSGTGTALVLDSPELMREWMRFADRFMTRNMFLEDGVYCDLSTSYQLQVTNHLRWAVFNFEQFRDPAGFREITDNVRFNGPGFGARWPLYSRAMTAIDRLHLPDGRLLPLGDTHCPVKPSASDRPNPDTANLEFNLFGLFSLRHGEGKHLRQSYLAFPPVVYGIPYRGGHQHMDSLTLQLWGGGSDQVPDAGYAAYRDGFSSNHKYFFHSARYHNTAMVWDRKAEPYSLQADKRTRSRLLAYEDGSGSDGLLQLVEASAPGPDFNRVRERRRLLLQVPLDADRSYTVDLFRLAGGEIHEFYLLQSENEACDLKLSAASAPLPGTLRDVLGQRGGKDYGQYLDFFQEVRRVDGAQPLAGEFVGEESGVRTRFFLNPLPGSENFFTTAPNLRRYVWQKRLPDGSKQHKFGELRGNHLTRHCAAAPKAATVFGAVYEILAAKEAPAIDRVEWFRDGEAAAVTIHTARGSDTVYSSPDRQTRTVDGVKFSGNLAVLRRHADGTPAWGYARNGGTIELGDFAVRSAPSKFLALEPAPTAERPDTVFTPRELFAPELYVKASSDSLQELAGQWVYTQLGDGSGFAAKVVRAENAGPLTRLVLNTSLPLRPQAKNRFTFVPLLGQSHTVHGPARIEITKVALLKR